MSGTVAVRFLAKNTTGRMNNLTIGNTGLAEITLQNNPDFIIVDCREADCKVMLESKGAFCTKCNLEATGAQAITQAAKAAL